MKTTMKGCFVTSIIVLVLFVFLTSCVSRPEQTIFDTSLAGETYELQKEVAWLKLEVEALQEEVKILHESIGELEMRLYENNLD